MSYDARYFIWMVRNRAILTRGMLPFEVNGVDEMIRERAAALIGGNYGNVLSKGAW